MKNVVCYATRATFYVVYDGCPHDRLRDIGICAPALETVAWAKISRGRVQLSGLRFYCVVQRTVKYVVSVSSTVNAKWSA
ncbi:hypothetical protein J6590_037890 [Homalodisca vitripennis]|nr:hypothetical protein J6590_037890 [Homalodisca vitripennis]